MKKFLTVIIVIALLFGVSATLERQLTPDGSTPQTTQSLMDFGEVVATWFQGMADSFKMFFEGMAELAESKTGGGNDKEESSTEIGEMTPEELPKASRKYYERYESENWETTSEDLKGRTRAGGNYENREKPGYTKLPEQAEDGTPITYKEYDARTTITRKTRGKKRFVHGRDGSTYYTEDHYKHFKKVIK